MGEWKDIFQRFDLFLASDRQTFEAVVIGGSALVILGIIDRQTRDADILVPRISESIRAAAARFAMENPDYSLDSAWLNNGPEEIQSVLPPGWHGRLLPLYSGSALKLETLAREDFLKTKLYAYCARGAPDLQDLLKMKPSQAELAMAFSWVKKCREQPQWPKHCEVMLGDLARALGHPVSRRK